MARRGGLTRRSEIGAAPLTGAPLTGARLTGAGSRHRRTEKGDRPTNAGPHRHSFETHVGEVLLRLEAPDLAGLIAEAGRALAGLLLESVPARPDGPAVKIAVAAPDREALLVEWLDELIFRSEVGKLVFVDFEVLRARDQAVTALAWPVPATDLRTAVKAATFHRLRVAEADGGLQATVVLDV